MAMPKKLSKKNKIKKKQLKSALHPETKMGIAAVICFTLALLTLFSYFKLAGAFGRYFLEFSRLFFGRAIFLIPLSFFLAGLAFLKSYKRPVYWPTAVGLIIFIFSILGIFHIFNNGDLASPRGGGYLGLLIGYPLNGFLGLWASLVVLLSLLLVSILATFNMPLRKKKEEVPEVSQKEGQEKISEPISFGAAVEQVKEAPLLFEGEKKPGFLERWKKRVERVQPKEKEEETEIKREAEDETRDSGDKILKSGKFIFRPSEKARGREDFKLPSLDFLERDKGQPTSGDIKANQNVIQRTLANFGIEVEMSEVNIGPTVTQYTLRPAQGVKLSKITALHNDLALALAAHPLRMETPIPGRALVGIEIPNRTAVLVRVRNLLENPAFKELPSRLSFALGRSVAGRPVFANLARMPHLLIAGATGAGKTIAINNLLINLLYQNSPKDLKFILIDPKRVELTPYNEIPHLLTPVIVQNEKAVNALRWAINEMEQRFEILHEKGARDIAGYNQRTENREQRTESGRQMPYIIIVIDELADLMASRGREVEGSVVRLAQMARAVGIHLVVSTQRPSVEVITGLIKANITSRIAFQVASQVDSRTILDMAGAEKLLGQGDMLYLAGYAAKPRRIQGTYISEKEVKKVTDYLGKMKAPEHNETIVESAASRAIHTGPAGSALPVSETDDELYEEAKKAISQAGRASASWPRDSWSA